jgi:hypothetical protein
VRHAADLVEAAVNGAYVDRASAQGIASIDWTWQNDEFRSNIGRWTPNRDWKLNTRR